MCSGCTQRWTGLNRCHCPVCHRTFGGVQGFDKHLPGTCKDPSLLGFEEKDGIWVRPLTDKQHRALKG